jgi:hypothetical protein
MASRAASRRAFKQGLTSIRRWLGDCGPRVRAGIVTSKRSAQWAADHSERWATLFVVVRPRPIVAIVTSRPIVAIVRSRPIVTIVRSRPIVPIVRPRLVIVTSGRVGACFNDRAAWSTELWSISPQARHDSVHIGNLRAAQPPDIRRAGHLLFCGSSKLLRTCHILSSDAATDRNRKAHENSMRSHVQSLFHKRAEVPHVDYLSSRFKINAAFQRQNVKPSASQCHAARARRGLCFLLPGARAVDAEASSYLGHSRQCASCRPPV